MGRVLAFPAIDRVMDRLPGFRDFYPPPTPNVDVWNLELRNHIFQHWRRTAKRYGFQEYDGPPVEPLELYTIKSGPEIVGQLYNFTDKGGREVALRPEMTPTLARMVATHERGYKKPLKWFSIPQLFRYERQQKGRLREHFQLNADMFGEIDPAADAELIALLIDTLRAFGLTSDDFVIRLSSRHAWRSFLQSRDRNGDREHEFFQIIDKLERDTEESTSKKLAALGLSLDEVTRFISEAHPTADLERIIDQLRARGLSDFVKIDYSIIRGLAYYSGTVFEAFDKKGEFRAIAGGGRYDGLVKLITAGKSDMPGLGFGMGDVVLTELLKSRGLAQITESGPDVFLLIEEESLRSLSLNLIQRLRDDGRQVEFSLTPARGDKQFKRAMELKARNVLRIERNCENQEMVWMKNLESRMEKRLALHEAVAAL